MGLIHIAVTPSSLRYPILFAKPFRLPPANVLPASVHFFASSLVKTALPLSSAVKIGVVPFIAKPCSLLSENLSSIRKYKTWSSQAAGEDVNVSAVNAAMFMSFKLEIIFASGFVKTGFSNLSEVYWKGKQKLV